MAMLGGGMSVGAGSLSASDKLIVSRAVNIDELVWMQKALQGKKRLGTEAF